MHNTKLKFYAELFIYIFIYTYIYIVIFLFAICGMTIIAVKSILGFFFYPCHHVLSFFLDYRMNSKYIYLHIIRHGLV